MRLFKQYLKKKLIIYFVYRGKIIYYFLKRATSLKLRSGICMFCQTNDSYYLLLFINCLPFSFSFFQKQFSEEMF